MNLFKSILLLVAATFGISSEGVTFTCNHKDGKLRATLTQRDRENTAVLVLSNPSVGEGKKTIAVFEDAKVEDEEFISVTAKVDFRNPTLKRGEYIGGTRLGQLKTISLTIEEDEDGEPTVGELKLEKRTKRVIDLDLKCSK